MKNQARPLSKSKVAILLGYYNGRQYIAEQVASIFAQSHQALHLFISDDHSPQPLDVDALGLQRDQLSRLTVEVRSKNLGFTKNFLTALRDRGADFDYFAFSDQDDVWYPDKLKNALDRLAQVDPNTPALYGARTETVDERCAVTLGASPLFSRPPAFRNALVQSIAGGNTMVFNKAARDLIVASLSDATVVSHDWWCYQMVSGAGGQVFYDSDPCLQYRQHGNNVVGANISWSARFRRFSALLQGDFRRSIDQGVKVLIENKHLLTKDSHQVLNNFVRARQSFLLKRLWLFWRSGVYRQTILGNIALYVGILLNKI